MALQVDNNNNRAIDNRVDPKFNNAAAYPVAADRAAPGAYPVGAYSEAPGNRSLTTFIIMEIFLFATLTAAFVWIFSDSFLGGIDGRIGTPSFFNLHAFFTTIGVIFFLSQALLMYRYAPLPTYDANNAVRDRELAWDTNMALQGCLQTLNWVCCLIAVVIAGVWKERESGLPFPSGFHYRTAHSWIGIVTLGVSFIQLLASFFTYIVPVVSYEWRLRSLPVHKWLGLISFLGFFLSYITGLQQPANPIGAEFNRTFYFANALCLASMALAGGLLYVLWPTWNYAGKGSPSDPVAHHAAAPVYNNNNMAVNNNVNNVAVPVAAY